MVLFRILKVDLNEDQSSIERGNLGPQQLQHTRRLTYF